MNSRARLIKAIDNSACLTRRQINDYIYQKLYPEELYVVEMHLNECPFCNDAIEGFVHAENANQLLSEVDTLQLPAADMVAEPLEEKVIAKKETIVPPVSKTPSATAKPSNTISFDDRDRGKRGMGWKIGLATAAVIGLGVWGINRINNTSDKENALLAQRADSAAMMDNGATRPVSRNEDSVMNAKYGFQNHQDQQPAAVAARNTYKEDAGMADSTAAMAVADVGTPATTTQEAAAPPAAAKMASPENKPKPVAVVAAKTAVPAAAKSKVPDVAVKESSTRTASASTARTATPVVAKEAAADKGSVEKTKVRPSAKTPEERAKLAEAKKTAAAQKAKTQAEADYKKGMELYNKKQYAAALLYFQSVAKNPDLPNSRQAARYVKLCKQNIAKTASPAKDQKTTK